MYAPIALFVYNRPDHTARTLRSLVDNAGFYKSRLHVFCDGPKHERDAERVAATRAAVKQFSLNNLSMYEQAENIGLGNSIIAGVGRLCAEHGRVIVIEDDLVTSPYFLEYMNRALDFYADDDDVMQISGYMLPVTFSSRTDTVFLPFTTSWGWGTWARAWRHFDAAASGFDQLSRDKALRQSFDLDSSYPYFRMLKRQLAGRIDSWAIRWYLSVFLRHGLVLFPDRSLVSNIGHDDSGVHSSPNKIYDVALRESPAKEFPPSKEVSLAAYQAVAAFYRANKPPLYRKAARFIHKTKRKFQVS